jgi:hypothetical protein
MSQLSALQSGLLCTRLMRTPVSPLVSVSMGTGLPLLSVVGMGEST